MQGFTFTNNVMDKDLNKYIGDKRYAIIYETTYLPYVDSTEHPWLYSGSTWINKGCYLGSCLNQKYLQIWQEEIKEYPERFVKNVIAVFDKNKINKQQLRDYEALYQKHNDHANDPKYFNVSNRRGGAGVTSDYAIFLRQNDPEKWKKIDKDSAIKAKKTKSKWTEKQKEEHSKKISKALKGKVKHTWDTRRSERPGCVYYISYTIQTPEGEIKTIDKWDHFKEWLALYNKDKHKDLKCGLERLVKKKKWKGFTILEIKQVNTEGKPPVIKYQDESYKQYKEP